MTDPSRRRRVRLGAAVLPAGALDVRIRDRAGTASVAVSYRGAVPEPFLEGREVIVTVRRRGDRFVGEPGSLITKCPSKSSARAPS